jgi:energy-converting hydrogenase B subunit L
VDEKMKSILLALKHLVFGVHNIGKILFGFGRLTDDGMREKILAGQVPELHTVDRELCLGCGVCSNICPTKAITMVPFGEKIEFAPNRFKEKIPEIDHLKCVYCYQCHDTCPVFTVHKKPAAIAPRGMKDTGIKAEDLFKKEDEDAGQ